MTCEHLETINWDAIWDRQWELTSFKGDGVDFWDTRAQLFERGPDADDYVAQFVSRLSLSPELSVLDVGCGIGTVTMALARQVRCVTALDWSPRMLEAVARRVAEQQLEHVRTVRLDWPQVQVGRDIELHDVVLASRSLPMGNLRGALQRLDQAALQACYLTWIVDGNALDAAVCRLLGREYHAFPAYTIIYNMLYEMGICAQVDIFRVAEKRVYASLDELVTHLIRAHRVTAQEDTAALRKLVSQYVSSEDSTVSRTMSTRWALIHWRKGLARCET